MGTVWVVLGAIALLGLQQFFARSMADPELFDDEFCYLAQAAFLTGLDWTAMMRLANVFHWGYSIFLVPVFWLTHDPYWLYQGALFWNGLALTLSFLCACRVARAIAPEASALGRTLAALAAVLYPANFYYSMYAMSESTLVLSHWVLLASLPRLLRRPSWWALGLFGVLLGVPFAIHGRGLSAAVAGLGLMAYLVSVRRVQVLRLPVFLAMLVMTLVLDHLVWSWFRAEAWLGGGQDPATNVASRLQLTPEFLLGVLQTAIGQAFYLGAASYLIAFLGVGGALWLGVQGWKQLRGKVLPEAEATVALDGGALGVLALLHLGALFGISVLATCTFPSYDGFLFGRYNEGALGGVLLIGFLAGARWLGRPQRSSDPASRFTEGQGRAMPTEEAARADSTRNGLQEDAERIPSDCSSRPAAGRLCWSRLVLGSLLAFLVLGPLTSYFGFERIQNGNAFLTGITGLMRYSYLNKVELLNVVPGVLLFGGLLLALLRLTPRIGLAFGLLWFVWTDVLLVQPRVEKGAAPLLREDRLSAFVTAYPGDGRMFLLCTKRADWLYGRRLQLQFPEAKVIGISDARRLPKDASYLVSFAEYLPKIPKPFALAAVDRWGDRFLWIPSESFAQELQSRSIQFLNRRHYKADSLANVPVKALVPKVERLSTGPVEVSVGAWARFQRWMGVYPTVPIRIQHAGEGSTWPRGTRLGILWKSAKTKVYEEHLGLGRTFAPGESLETGLQLNPMTLAPGLYSVEAGIVQRRWFHQGDPQPLRMEVLVTP